MNKNELCNLRKNSFLKFNSPSELLSKLEIISKDFQVPLVHGYKEFGPANWKVTYLKPKEMSDELTLRNFIEGIKKIDESQTLKEHFSAEMHYNGTETMHYSEFNENILAIFVQEKKNPGYFGLHISFQDNKEYSAKASIYTSDFEKTMERFIGPNKKE